jgi:hypothetical protein
LPVLDSRNQPCRPDFTEEAYPIIDQSEDEDGTLTALSLCWTETSERGALEQRAVLRNGPELLGPSAQKGIEEIDYLRQGLAENSHRLLRGDFEPAHLPLSLYEITMLPSTLLPKSVSPDGTAGLCTGSATCATRA